MSSCNSFWRPLKELDTYILLTLSGNSLPKSCLYFETPIQWDSLNANWGSDMLVKCCLTTFWASPPFKIALKHRCSWWWTPVSPDGIMSFQDTDLNQSCRSIHNWTSHMFTLHLPQQNEAKVKTTLDLWVWGSGCHTEVRALDFLCHEHSQADLFFFPSWSKYFQQWSWLQQTVFLLASVRSCQAPTKTLLVHAPLFGKLRESCVSVAHCWQLWLFIQILLILDKHLERLMRMQNMCLHTCIRWHMAHT